MEEPTVFASRIHRLIKLDKWELINWHSFYFKFILFQSFLVNENIKINDRKSLKDYMREQNIPPWKRDRVMLIYIKDELKVVWDKV